MQGVHRILSRWAVAGLSVLALSGCATTGAFAAIGKLFAADAWTEAHKTLTFATSLPAGVSQAWIQDGKVWLVPDRLNEIRALENTAGEPLPWTRYGAYVVTDLSAARFRVNTSRSGWGAVVFEPAVLNLPKGPVVPTLQQDYIEVRR